VSEIYLDIHELKPACLSLDGTKHWDVLLILADQKEFQKIDTYKAFLTAAEQQRYQRLIRKQDKHNFILSRLLTKLGVAEITHYDWKEIEFFQEENKKPYLLDADKNVYFNFSHASDKVLMALSPRCEVGVDIERIKPVIKTELVARSYYSENEQKHIAQSVNPQREFFRFWVRKEAIVKLLGNQLLDDLQSLDVSSANAQISSKINFEPYSNLFLHCFSVDDYEACVALPEKISSIAFLEMNEQLLAKWMQKEQDE
jgi:phosphopantetheinyl transferase